MRRARASSAPAERRQELPTLKDLTRARDRQDVYAGLAFHYAAGVWGGAGAAGPRIQRGRLEFEPDYT